MNYFVFIDAGANKSETQIQLPFLEEGRKKGTDCI